MTERELIETYYELLNFINSNFQIWLSATFALTMAFHFAGENISKPLKRYLFALYGVASFIFFVRFMNAGVMLGPIRDRVAEEHPATALAWFFSPTLIGPLIIIVMVAGSVGAIYYSNKLASNDSRPKNEDTIDT